MRCMPWLYFFYLLSIVQFSIMRTIKNKAGDRRIDARRRRSASYIFVCYGAMRNAFLITSIK